MRGIITTLKKISGATVRPETDAEHEHDMQKFDKGTDMYSAGNYRILHLPGL